MNLLSRDNSKPIIHLIIIIMMFDTYAIITKKLRNCRCLILCSFPAVECSSIPSNLHFRLSGRIIKFTVRSVYRNCATDNRKEAFRSSFIPSCKVRCEGVYWFSLSCLRITFDCGLMSLLHKLQFYECISLH